MEAAKKKPAKVSLKVPQIVRDNKRALVVFRQVQEYLRRCGEIEKVDSETVGLYALGVSDFERYTEFLRGEEDPVTGERKSREFYNDKNGSPRKHPATMLKKQALEQMLTSAKTLGIDRGFREKGRGDKLSKGSRRPVDKAGMLRKVG
jgi:phage terminase small subunit